MSSGFGMFTGAVMVVMCLWFIHVGFMVKNILKETQETNRLLRQLGNAGSAPAAGSKGA